ncbi:hypothetical protein FA15DRAFT_493173 [Coprinopsis marcescibilis]|uniref:Uncharacterized protein n=1 Tax=Coprinopsis marcescibilis TaxID=230819 RepID=A0A5C3L488_COPMA|nr:hypothetical protein FA15DRAFT_493173 [Coprinopsis marcescibilis]
MLNKDRSASLKPIILLGDIPSGPNSSTISRRRQSFPFKSCADSEASSIQRRRASWGRAPLVGAGYDSDTDPSGAPRGRGREREEGNGRAPAYGMWGHNGGGKKLSVVRRSSLPLPFYWVLGGVVLLIENELYLTDAIPLSILPLSRVVLQRIGHHCPTQPVLDTWFSHTRRIGRRDRDMGFTPSHPRRRSTRQGGARLGWSRQRVRIRV